MQARDFQARTGPSDPPAATGRRVLLLGGLGLALGVSACGRTTLSGTRAAGTPGGMPGSTAAQGATSGGESVEVIGSYAIHDAVTGTSMQVRVAEGYRTIVANGLPDHPTGSYPNPMTAQSFRFVLPQFGTRAPEPTVLRLPQSFGIAVNGVPFDPLAAEWFGGDPASGWTIEAIGPHSTLHLDDNNGHVQPSGSYHYHGIPAAVAGRLGGTHSPLLGWAGDGFPIYARFGYRDAEDPASPVVDLTSSYRLRSGRRPDGPGGSYDGTYTEDFVYAEGHGDLDAANGRSGVTPEYPDGTYYYVLTRTFPFVPRQVVGTLAPSFVERPGEGTGRRPGGGPPPPRR